MLSHCTVARKRPTAEQRTNLQSELERFLSAAEAQELMLAVNDLAAQVDEEVDRILRDPLVAESWSYDGRCFVAAGDRFGLQVVFDGFHILEWLQTYARYLLSYKKLGVNHILKELDTFLWLARVRRINWEEEGHLGVLPREVIDLIVADIKDSRRASAERQASPPSAEECSFFEPYEEEMKAVKL